MTVNVDLRGFDDAEHRFRVLAVWLQEAASKAFRGMIASMTGAKSGRIYKIGKNRTHQASAPGQAPAVLTGQLRSSITINRVTDYEYVVSIAIVLSGRTIAFVHYNQPRDRLRIRGQHRGALWSHSRVCNEPTIRHSRVREGMGEFHQRGEEILQWLRV